MADHRILGKTSWTIRRRIIVGTLLWCVALVTYLAIFGRPVSLSETIANGCLLLMASVIGSYVFGAVWDDKRSAMTPGTTEVYQRITAPPVDAPPPGPAMPEPPREGN